MTMQKSSLPVTEIFASMVGKRVTGIEVPGWIDRDSDRPVFTPWSRTAYLVFEEGFLRLTAVGSSGRLALDEMDTVEPFPGIEDLEEEFSTAQVRDILFGEDDTRVLTRVRYTLGTHETSDPQAMCCAEFVFAPNGVLFADPWWTFGIRLGGEGAYDRWIADMEDSPAGPFTEYVWEP